MNEKHKRILIDHGYNWRVVDDTRQETLKQEALKTDFRHTILALSRVDALDNLLYMYANYESVFGNVDMLDLIATMMSALGTYDETNSDETNLIDKANKAGLAIAGSSNYDDARRYVAYLSTKGRDYLWDWIIGSQNIPELQKASDLIKDMLYEEFCQAFEAELAEHRKSTEDRLVDEVADPVEPTSSNSRRR